MDQSEASIFSSYQIAWLLRIEWRHQSCQSNFEDVIGRDVTHFRPIRAQHSLTAPQTPGNDRLTGSQEICPNCSPDPGNDRATGSQEICFNCSPDPGNDRGTGSQEICPNCSPDSRKWPRDRKLRMNPSTASQTPEMTARPEVNNEPLNCFPDSRKWPRNRKSRNDTHSALLHNGINGLYICVGWCTLTLVVPLWENFQQRMRIK